MMMITVQCRWLIAPFFLIFFSLFKEIKSLENISSIPDIVLLPKTDCFPTNIRLLLTLWPPKVEKSSKHQSIPTRFLVFIPTCAYMHVHMAQFSHTDTAAVVVSAEDGSVNKTSSQRSAAEQRGGACVLFKWCFCKHAVNLKWKGQFDLFLS